MSDYEVKLVTQISALVFMATRWSHCESRCARVGMIGARLGWLVLALRAIYCKQMAECSNAVRF